MAALFTTTGALSKRRQASNQPIKGCTELVVIDAVLPRVHLDQGVTDNVLKEWTFVDAAELGTHAFGLRISEHDEFVAREGLEKV